MNLKQVILLFIGILLFECARSQDTVSASSGKMLAAYTEKVFHKANNLEQKLDRKTTKLLSRLQKQESKMKRKLLRIDSSKAKTVFGDMDLQYKRLEDRLKSGVTGTQKYIPSLDTMAGSLKFIQQNPQLLSAGGLSPQKLTGALDKVKSLEGQFQKAEEVKKFLKQRKQYLAGQLGQLGFAKDVKKLNKQAFYYNQQLNEYKSLLKDHKKAERKAIALLRGAKPFKDFMRKNSMLASLFRLPGEDGLSPFGGAGGGLQSRVQVNNLIQQQVTTGGPNLPAGQAGAQQQFSQNLQAAQAQMNQLKDKLVKAGAGSSDEEMPDFKSNSQKTKSFWKRIELGTNIQSQKANGYFPVTSDIGLSVGYKLSDKSIIGIGSSYKLGLGQNIRHINITHQGVGLRSFVDWKIKGSFWISGGYEMNYRSEFENIEQLKDYSAWQQSGLIGLSKILSLHSPKGGAGGGFFKKTKLQLLWDFLSYGQVPQTQAVVFRVGYDF